MERLILEGMQPPPMLVSVWVDLNSRSDRGYVRAHLGDASGPVTEGQSIVAYDENEDGLYVFAEVVSVDEQGRVLLAVDWSTARHDDDTAATPTKTKWHGQWSTSVVGHVVIDSPAPSGGTRPRRSGFDPQQVPA